jgi:wyosine [tRNA(Phe)-imidazoG37] synthetase (radical SAM superfamily)
VSAAQLEADLTSLGTVAADCVTFAGLGEPTLAANLALLTEVARQHFSIPIIVLTGSGLMPQADVRRDLLAFDAVVCKLDAGDEDTFRHVNHPGPGFPYHLVAIVDGIRRFRQEYSGKLVLQMMFVQANLRAASQMAALARSLAPDEVQLNTPLQPALGKPISPAQMQKVARAFAGMPVQSIYRDGKARITPRFM